MLISDSPPCSLVSVPKTPRQFKQWLHQQGYTFEPGNGGHLTVRRGNRKSTLPMHGKRDMPKGTMEAIKRNLGLKDNPKK